MLGEFRVVHCKVWAQQLLPDSQFHWVLIGGGHFRDSLVAYRVCVEWGVVYRTDPRQEIMASHKTRHWFEQAVFDTPATPARHVNTRRTRRRAQAARVQDGLNGTTTKAVLIRACPHLPGPVVFTLLAPNIKTTRLDQWPIGRFFSACSQLAF